MAKLNGYDVSQTPHATYVTDEQPADAKTRVATYAIFNAMPAKAKWDGMLVFVQAIGKWHQYDKPTDTLIPFGGSGSSTIVIENGFRLVWKYPGNINKDILEPNDVIEGFLEGVFIKARFVAGPENLRSSYTELETYTQ
ncbi:hypothetical protein MA9V1_052 [Chryseobacterium phage MA9V-1]|nr:hypothetical protein MA9V1_052 [Chryseobacterium phage MA9V-1]